MARPLRIEYPGAFYHVTSRGNERKKIFFAKADFGKFRDYLIEAQVKYDFVLHCYVLMSNHFHLIIEARHANLSQLMHYINGSYTNYINRRRRRSGHLFQGRYKAILVDWDSYLLELTRYLHLNPVRAKMVERPELYEHSSYGCYIGKCRNESVHPDLALSMLSKNPREAAKRYKDFVEKAIDQALESPLEKVYGGLALGSAKFIKEALNRLERNTIARDEVSHRREIQNILGSEEIVSALSRHFEFTNDELLKDRSEIRNTTIYFMKEYTGLTNRELGSLFGGMSYSAISKAYARFLEKLEVDAPLRKLLKSIESELSHVKG